MRKIKASVGWRLLGAFVIVLFALLALAVDLRHLRSEDDDASAVRTTNK